LICTLHDTHLDDGRTRWAEHEPKCEDPDCQYCPTRPETPEACPHGPCLTCKHLDTYLGNKRLKGIVALINRHKTAKHVIHARLLRSKNDHAKNRIVVTCRFTNEVVAEIEGGAPSNKQRPAGARYATPTVRAACWWVDYLEDLPDSEEVAKPSRRAQEEARRLELSGHWKELRWPLI